MTVMLIVSILLAVSFIGAAIWRIHDIPVSISSLVYTLPKNQQWMWIVWMWGVSLLLTPPLLDALGDYSLIGFLTIGCLIFCGAMPLVRNESNTLHNVFGITAGVLSQIDVALINAWWLLSWLIMLPFVFGAMASFDDTREPEIADGKGVFLAEGICFISLVMSIIIK